MTAAPRRTRSALLVALAVDNLGSGMFLPLSVVYLDRVVGLSLATAGLVLTAGGCAGLVAPALAGRLAERTGPRTVVVGAHLVQAAGLVVLLLAGNAMTALLAAILLAVGGQAFYGAVFGLVADVAGPDAGDRPFALVGQVRAGAFGAGTLLAAVLVTVAGDDGLVAAVVVDAVSFVGAAVLLGALVQPLATHCPDHGPATGTPTDAPVRVTRNRPFLVLIVAAGLIGLTTDVVPVGLPVFTLDRLGTPPWLAGVCLAVLTAATATGATTVLRWTSRWRRTTAVARGAGLLTAWALGAAAVSTLAGGPATVALLVLTPVLVAGDLLVSTRVNALAVAAAPASARARHLGAFQYAFTVATLVAPVLVALFAVAAWLPWVVVALGSTTAIGLLVWLARRLPPAAVTPEPVSSARPRP